MSKYRPSGGILQWSEVGDHAIVWSRGKKKPTGEKGCVISAHGGEAQINGTLTLRSPSITLVWYGPHGVPLKDPMVGMVARKLVVEHGTTTVARGTTPDQDYILSKFQGKHGGGKVQLEDYDSIRQGMHPETYQDFISQGFKVMDQERNLAPIVLDVVTIRNRNCFYSSPTLFKVISDLHANGWIYNEIHCSFCRGAVGEYKPALKPAPALA
jgi:hypothetical protein